MIRSTLVLLATMAAAAALQAQEVPVHRWYHSGSQWHLYTANPGERPAGWQPEAIVFRLYAPGTPGTVPLYRLQRSDGGHFYTSDVAELNAVRGRGWQVEGVLGHIAQQPRPGAVALHRFLKGNGRHFYPTDRAEGSSAGFRHEGVIGYVPDGDDAAARERMAAAERQRQAEEAARQRQAEEAERQRQEAARVEAARAAAARVAAEGPYDVAITTAAGMCLVPPADRAGATVYVRPCTEGGAMYRIENGYVVTAGGNCLTPSARGVLLVQLARCRTGRPDGSPQQWYFHPNKLVQNAARANLCLDVEGESRQAGARVLAYECRSYESPPANQRFLPGGAFRLGLWALVPMTPEARRAVLEENGAALFSNGTLVIAAGGGNVIAAGGGNVIAAGGGNVISSGGNNVISSGGNNVISSGGNNVISSGGNNVISSGGNNLRVVQDPSLLIQGASVIASGGGNVIAAGGGNVIASGGNNLVAPGGP
jgi:hypothetical protein